MAGIPPGTDLSTIPLAPNPNGDPPNFIDPPNSADLVLKVGLPIIIVTSMILTIRLSMTSKMHGKLLLDDYFCILGFVTLVPFFAMSVIGTKETGRHIWDIPVSAITTSYVKQQFALQMLTGPFIWASKVAVTILYLRVFAANNKWFRWCCYILLAIITPGYWQSVFLSIAWCSPRAGKPWDFAVLSSCAKAAVEGPVQGAMSLFADIALLILPIPVIFALHLSMKKKIGLALVFSVGIITIITGAISLYYRVNIYTSTDKFWNGPKINACAIVDSAVGIWVSSTPAIAAFWNKFLANSPLFSTIRSIFTRSTVSESSSSNIKSSKNRIADPESHTNLVRSDYYELHERDASKLSTFITSERSATPFTDDHSGIRRFTAIQQSSEVGEAKR